jgi:hypothetical protein
MRFVLCLLVIVGVGTTACTRSKGPTQTLDRYGRALKNRDFGSAYDLMSSSFRSKVSREDYVRMMRDNVREVDETADRLRGKKGSLEVSAEFQYGLGDKMLSSEDGKWKIRRTRSFLDQSTAQRAALFLRAPPER